MRRVPVRSRKLNKFNLRLRLNKLFSLKHTVLTMFLLLIIIALGPLSINFFIRNHYKSLIFDDIDKLDAQRVAIVLANENSSLDEAKKLFDDRITTSVDLYRKGKAQKILVFINADIYSKKEVKAKYKLSGIRDFDLELKIEEESKYYSNCYMAKSAYGLNDTIIVTQEVFMARALYTCNTLGINSVGIVSDRRLYINSRDYQLAEYKNILTAFNMLYISRPENNYSEKEYI